MEIQPVDIVIYIINIALLFVLLRIILWKPINRYLTMRAERIRKEIEQAKETRVRAEELQKEYARGIDGLEAQGREILRKSQTKASEEAEELLKDARAKADQILREAHERITEERERAVINARNEVAQIATDMAARILKREVSPDDNKNAVEEFFKESR